MKKRRARDIVVGVGELAAWSPVVYWAPSSITVRGDKLKFSRRLIGKRCKLIVRVLD